jgi:hypothetical protein
VAAVAVAAVAVAGVAAGAAAVAAAAGVGDGAAGAKFRDLTTVQSPPGPSRETHPLARVAFCDWAAAPASWTLRRRLELERFKNSSGGKPRSTTWIDITFPLILHLYSITSSARPDKGSGTVMPSAFADFALMNSSSLVPC